MLLPNLFTSAGIGNYYLIGVEKVNFWLAAVALGLLVLGVMYVANLAQPVPGKVSWAAAEIRRHAHRTHRKGRS